MGSKFVIGYEPSSLFVGVAVQVIVSAIAD